MFHWLGVLLFLWATSGQQARATLVGAEGKSINLQAPNPPPNENYPCTGDQTKVPVVPAPKSSLDPNNAKARSLNNLKILNIRGSILRDAPVQITCQLKLECVLEPKTERGACPDDSSHSVVYGSYGRGGLAGASWMISVERIVEARCDSDDWDCYREACYHVDKELGALDRLCQDTALFRFPNGKEEIEGACCAGLPFSRYRIDEVITP